MCSSSSGWRLLIFQNGLSNSFAKCGFAVKISFFDKGFSILWLRWSSFQAVKNYVLGALFTMEATGFQENNIKTLIEFLASQITFKLVICYQNGSR